jgi:hypothetical protein
MPHAQNMPLLKSIRGLRFRVVTVLWIVAGGMSVDEIVDGHPDLQPEDIPAALNYAVEVLAELPAEAACVRFLIDENFLLHRSRVSGGCSAPWQRVTAGGDGAARAHGLGQLRPAVPVARCTPTGGVGDLIAAPLHGKARRDGVNGRRSHRARKHSALMVSA